MRLTRTNLDPTLSFFGAPVEAQDAPRIEGQQQRLEAIMADGFWHTVPQLQKELKRRHGQLYSETSISARLRAMRKRGFTVTHERTRAGSNLYQYRAVKNGAPVGLREIEPTSDGWRRYEAIKPSAEDLDAIAAETKIAEATL